MSAEHASFQTLIPNHEEEGDPGQRKGDDEGYEEPGCVKAMVWKNLRGQESDRDSPVVTLHTFRVEP